MVAFYELFLVIGLELSLSESYQRLTFKIMPKKTHSWSIHVYDSYNI